MKLKNPHRRWLILGGLASMATAAVAWLNPFRHFRSTSMSESTFIETFPIDFQWKTTDPFLFCAYHYDLYPKANGEFGPAESLVGRNLGQDFQVKDGYRMYHGEVVPGFPVHPHRGFETITLVRKGFVDHADSLGAAGRYGAGDVQWMTAGQGIQHSEMFPLLDQNEDNHLELLQIWINLPKANKMVPADYKMYWAESIPRVTQDNDNTYIDVIAGDFEDTSALEPPEHSWASRDGSDVAVWVIEMKPGATAKLPAAPSHVKRTLYFYEGDGLQINGQEISKNSAAVVQPEQPLELKSSQASKILVLQGKPIGEPVAQYGPFVMNTEQEIRQAIADYQQTRFGGWPWNRDDMVHGSEKKRFGRHSNGKQETPDEKA